MEPHRFDEDEIKKKLYYFVKNGSLFRNPDQ